MLLQSNPLLFIGVHTIGYIFKIDLVDILVI